MNGRKENDAKLQATIENYLEDKPKYLKQYCETLWKKTCTTKRQYICNIWKFIEYVRDNSDLNINRINDICKVKPSLIDSYLGSMNVKNTTKAGVYYAIYNFYDFLVKDERISVNPCSKIEPPRDNEIHEITYLTNEEIKIVENNIITNCGSQNEKYKWTNRDLLIFALGITTGMRVSSMVEINLQDIDWDEGYIDIYQKGNKELKVKISNKILLMISDWLDDRDEILDAANKDSDALFISARCTRLSARTINNLIEKYSYNIDKKITPHKLRSTCATQLIKKTGNIYLASQRLGHSNVETTKRYAAIDKEMEQQAVDAMDSVLF